MEGVILRNAVSSSSRFFVAFPIAVTQVSSNMDVFEEYLKRKSRNCYILLASIFTFQKPHYLVGHGMVTGLEFVSPESTGSSPGSM